MITIALYSMKGGVGKTAATVNLAHLASLDGFRTLICDLDPQGASSWYFRIRAGKNFNSNKFIKGGRSIDEYDYLFLDCPPGISLVSENILNAADVVLVPLVPTPLSVLTFEKLGTFLDKKEFDAAKIYPFFSMAERRKSLHLETMDKLSAENRNVLASVIPYRSEVERMGVYREPLTANTPGSFSAKAYAALWTEVKELTTGNLRESYG